LVSLDIIDTADLTASNASRFLSLPHTLYARCTTPPPSPSPLDDDDDPSPSALAPRAHTVQPPTRGETYAHAHIITATITATIANRRLDCDELLTPSSRRNSVSRRDDDDESADADAPSTTGGIDRIDTPSHTTRRDRRDSDSRA
jgi:hypothetical protein